MREILVNLYKIRELCKKSQDRAVHWWREHEDYPLLHETVEDTVRQGLAGNEVLLEKGPDVYYSLGYCQGDGACFTGRFIWEGFTIDVRHYGHYYHSNSCYHEFLCGSSNLLDETVVQKRWESWGHEAWIRVYKEICRQAEKDGYMYIDDCYREEHILELLEINEFEFTEDGKVWTS